MNTKIGTLKYTIAALESLLNIADVNGSLGGLYEIAEEIESLKSQLASEQIKCAAVK